MSEEVVNACTEYQRLSRRQLLGGAAAAGVTLPIWAPKVAYGQSHSSTRDRLIMINLSGGSDGLSFCAPHGDPVYYDSRPGIAVPQPGNKADSSIDIDGYFSFPRAFEELLDPFNSGHMSVLHAVGRENWSFSHFDATKWMQQGEVTQSGNGGWLARHLASVDEVVPDAEIRAMNLHPTKPVVLHGGEKVFTAWRADEVKYGGSFGSFNTSSVKEMYLRQYMRLRDRSRSAVRDGVRAANLISQMDLVNYVGGPGIVYDNSDFGHSMRCMAGMMKADDGIEVFFTNIVNWDTHVEQGTVGGTLDTKMNDLARNVTMFYRDMMNAGITNWTIVVVSEFGRRINENGGHGTEHGEGNTMLVLSPNLKASAGGKIITDWPGIEVENRTRHDGLRPTTDDRDVWAEILTKRLENPNLEYIFPDHEVQKTDLLFEAA